MAAENVKGHSPAREGHPEGTNHDIVSKCLFGDCFGSITPESLCEHCHKAHLPIWMQDKSDLRVTRRVHAAMWLLQMTKSTEPVEMLTTKELKCLWDEVSSSMVFRNTPLQEQDLSVCQATCVFLGEAAPETFSLDPPNSVGLCTHWAVTIKLLSSLPEDKQELFKYLPFSKTPGWDMVDAHFHIDRLAQKYRMRHGVDEVLHKAPQPPEEIKGILSEAVANFCDSGEYQSIPSWLAQKAEVMMYATVGLHPKEVATLSMSEVEKHIRSMVDLQQHEQVVGIGEIGLDYSLPHLSTDASRMKQQEILNRILSHIPPGTPVVIHCRSDNKGAFTADKDVFNILKECPVPFPVQLHCFTGDMEMVNNYLGLERDVYFSLSNFSLNGCKFVQVVKAIPRDRLLVETDSPYLSPLGRGQNNSPRLVGMVANQLASMLGIPFQQVLWLTSANTRRLFRLP